MPIKIYFNSASATIYGSLSPQASYAITNALTYTDRGISFQNKRQRWNSQNHQNPEICLYQVKEQKFPTGLLGRVCMILQKSGVEFTLENQIPFVSPTELNIPDKTYEHQIDIVTTTLEERRGIIKSPTGSGKTFAGAVIISHFPKSQVLMTVPLKGLLHQTAKELSEVLNEPIGLIGDGIFEPQRITVGIINSLANLVGKNKYRFQDVEVMLVDECHRAASSLYTAVGNATINADFKIGLSATPWRSNGDDLVLEGVLGTRILDIPETAMIDNKVSVPPEYYCIPMQDPNLLYKGAKQIQTPAGLKTYYPGEIDSKPDQKEVYAKALMFNSDRNTLIVQAGEMFWKSPYPFPGVVLVERIEDHGIPLQEAFAEIGINIPFIHGQTKTKDRNEVIEGLGSKYRLIIASGILKEGVNIKQLGFAIIAGGGSNSTGILQRIGRVTRSFPNKRRAIIIDFEDQEQWYLKGAFNNRRTAVEKAYPGAYKPFSIKDLPAILMQA